jgi:23S rRNA (adenine2503-C2)-methyltransferase
MNLKNIAMSGNAGLQLSINSTSDFHRKEMFQGCSYNLEEISLLMKEVIESTGVKGRKISLNFALTDAPIRADDLKRLFDPQYFMVKITPMHMTKACADNHIVTKDGYASYYPYKKVEDELKAVGFDVIVFIPSLEEDMGRITCGNAILSGTRPEMMK